MEAAPNREHIRNMAEARAHVKRDGGCYIRPVIHALHDQRDGRVAFGEREECQMAQSAENVGLGKSDSGFDYRFIPGLFWACWKNSDGIMRRHRAVGAVDLGVVERGLGDPALQIVGILWPPPLCGASPRNVLLAATLGHISLKGPRAIRAVLVRFAKLVFAEAPPKKSKVAGRPRALPVSS